MNKMKPREHTDLYGFHWEGPGGSVIQVERTAIIERGKKGTTRIMEVRTPRQKINIYVSPTGMLRIFDTEGGEWRKPVKP